MTTSRKAAVKAWAGFVDDELHWFCDYDIGTIEKRPAIYKHRTTARRNYEDVREVHITLQPPGGGGR